MNQLLVINRMNRFKRKKAGYFRQGLDFEEVSKI
jgi:hypothetical protein